jgi:hypothetical protein
MDISRQDAAQRRERERMKRILFIAVVATLTFAGGAYGAAKITGTQIKDSTITGKDIKNGSLTAADFKGSVQGSQGLQGPAGPAGPQGPAGPGAVAGLTPVTSPQVYFTSASYAQTVTANCPAGQRVVSGGGASISFAGLSASQANASRTGWFVVGSTDDPTFSGQYVQAYALCAPANVAVASSANSKAKDKAQIDGIVDQINAQQR